MYYNIKKELLLYTTESGEIMDDDKNKNSLPDISGIFDVDDSRIPEHLINRPDLTSKRERDSGEGVLLENRQPTKAEQLKKQQRVRRRGNAAKKRRLHRKRINTALIVLAAVIVLALGIKAAVANSKKPTVEIYTVTVGAVQQLYDSPGSVVTAAAAGSPILTYAVIPENSYDLMNIAVGNKAMIKSSAGVQFEAKVAAIENESADTELTSELKEALPEKEFSASANILIYVKPDAPMNAADGEKVSVSIITDECTDTPFVPDECIITDKDGSYVWAVNRFTKVLSKKYITTALSAGGNTAVLGGLKKNERVVSKTVSDPAQFPLTEGKKVKITTAADSEKQTTEEQTA